MFPHHPAPPLLVPGARRSRRAGPRTLGLCEPRPGRSGSAPRSGHRPVRTRGAARGAGWAFPVEGKRRRNALLHPPPFLHGRIEPAESGRGLRGGGSPGDARLPAPSGKLGAKPGPGAAGSIGALMVQ